MQYYLIINKKMVNVLYSPCIDVVGGGGCEPAVPRQGVGEAQVLQVIAGLGHPVGPPVQQLQVAAVVAEVNQAGGWVERSGLGN